MKLRDLKGLGPASEKFLAEIGINTPDDLRKIGPIRAYMRLKEETDVQPSLNLLYAMVGALEDSHWTDIAKLERERLLMELDGYRDLEKMLRADGNGFEI
ncbi:TfoX/Sxy family protein [Salinispirillum marinum]|uniref:TfoX/Sxy family protein n=2 Tax=Saccharospirillaceae TaxID=255527 RepID=A0ABV8BH58_9GAMM